MSDEGEIQDEQLPLEGAGQVLRRAREDAKMSIAQVAAETRIPQRHLEMIEAGDFAMLPARTYAIGFSRSYAKAVGLDQKVIAAQVRDELAALDPDELGRGSGFEPGDPGRIPTRGLAWFSAFAALLLIVGGFMFFRDYFIPGSGPGPLVEDTPQIAEGAGAAPASDQAATVDQGGEVVFTALEDQVWVKFYDADNNQLMQKEMAKGERYAIPADAQGPQIWTGKPYALGITIGGKPVPKLADDVRTMRDVPVTAAALLARAAPGTVPQTASPTPASSPTPSPAPTPAPTSAPAAGT